MTFSFLNETRHVVGRGWPAQSSRLWRYNLHYFDDLNAVDAVTRCEWHEEAIASWLRDNPYATKEGWEPYPTSLRIVNWIKWTQSGASLSQGALDSLAVQVRALEGRLEWRLLGNHLLANAKALVFAGTYFEGPEAGHWLERGLGILRRELAEQVLPDGGQFERSPMYHALALEDLLDLVNLNARFPQAIPAEWALFVQSWPAMVRRMRVWLRAMCHPDGEISFFNDAAIGIAPHPAETERYAVDLLGDLPRLLPAAPGAIEVTRLHESGYVRAESPAAVLLLDVAPVGPDYLPGHAHADTLSFELSLLEQRVIVNVGISTYEPGTKREEERGTPAHSTVTVDGEDSSEVWAAFRVARRARPVGLEVRSTRDQVEVTCSHDGYRRLPGRPMHRRRWCLGPASLVVEDHVEGRFGSAVARFHFHPRVSVIVEADGRSGTLALPDGQTVRWRVSAGEARIDEGFHCPVFGRRDPSRCLAVALSAEGRSCLELAW